MLLSIFTALALTVAPEEANNQQCVPCCPSVCPATVVKKPIKKVKLTPLLPVIQTKEPVVERVIERVVERTIIVPAPVVNVIIHVDGHKEDKQQFQREKAEVKPTFQRQTTVKEWTPKWVRFGILGTVGLFPANPVVFGKVGVRLTSPMMHIGIEINHQFAWGLGLQGMVYPVVSRYVSWHLNSGILMMRTLLYAVNDVPRTIDMTFGTGAEFHVFKFMSLLVDYRVAMPTFGTLAALSVPRAGRALNVGNVVGNSLLRSQLMFGIMLHTW